MGTKAIEDWYQTHLAPGITQNLDNIGINQQRRAADKNHDAIIGPNGSNLSVFHLEVELKYKCCDDGEEKTTSRWRSEQFFDYNDRFKWLEEGNIFLFNEISKDCN